MTLLPLLRFTSDFFTISEEEKKRLLMSLAPDDTYHAVGFSYDQKTQEAEEKVENSEPHVLVDQPQLIQHPPTSSVDIVEHARDCYQVPQGLFVSRSVPTVSDTRVNLTGHNFATFSGYFSTNSATHSLHSVVY